MNLNDFVSLQNNKAKSVKLKGRNLQELQMETGTLAQENKEMEEKLQHLKERMSKEKEERGNSGGFRWKSGQCGALNIKTPTNSSTKHKDNTLQKLSEGRVNIRVLKDESLTVPPQAPPPTLLSSAGLQKSRRNKLKGKRCGQCEVKTAGLMCAECAEDYCIGCFTKFHQKGALKLHRMIPIQSNLKTNVNTQDVASCFEEQLHPNSCPGVSTNHKPGPKLKSHSNPNPLSNALTSEVEQFRGNETETEAKPWDLHHHSSQVLVINNEEKPKETMETTPRSDCKRGLSSSLLRGAYSEEESARSFQEALKQWRGENSDAAGETTSKEATWTPTHPVLMSAMATQTDPTSDERTKGCGGGEGAVREPVGVQFTESSLTYMDRLLLKKHRRQIQDYCSPLAFGPDLKSPLSMDTEKETSPSFTAEEEDFRCYFASLFAVPVNRDRVEPQTTTPEPDLIVEVLNEKDGDTDGVSDTEQRTDNKRKDSSGLQFFYSGRKTVPKTGLTEALSTKSNRSACTTAETSRTSKKSFKTSSSKSQNPCHSPTVKKSKPDCISLRLSSLSSPDCHTKTPKSLHVHVPLPSNVSPLVSATSPILEEPLSHSPSMAFSLRSTFTVSPSSSCESALLPKVYQSTPLQQSSDSSQLPEQTQSPHLFSRPISSVRLSQSLQSNLQPQRQYQHFLCDPEFPLSHNQPQSPLSPSPLSPNLLPRSPEPSQPVRSPSAAYSRQKSTLSDEEAPLVMSFSSVSGEHKSTATQQDAQCISSTPCHHFTQDSHLSVRMLKEEELWIDSEDDMSSDSLDLAPHENNSSDEDTEIHGLLMIGRDPEEEQGNCAILCHSDDSLVAAEGEKQLQTNEQEQLSRLLSVMNRRCVGSGSEQLCDLDEFLPLSLDINSSHSKTPKTTHSDFLHTSQTLLNKVELTGSEDFEPRSSLISLTEDHLAIRLMKDNHLQPTEIKIHSTTLTRRGEISATEPGTYVFDPELRPMSQAAKEIQEICKVDLAGYEDPDLDTKTTMQTLCDLEQEPGLLTKGMQISLFSERQGKHGNYHFAQGRVSEEQKDEEAAAQRDRESVLLLP